MTATLRFPLSGPVIEAQPALDLVGIERTYDARTLAAIPNQWEEFQTHLAALDRARVGSAFGIVRNAAPNMAAVTYLCAVPAGRGLDPGGAVTAHRLPALRLAKFTLRGHVSAIKEATDHVFGTALAAAGLRPAGGIDLIEQYGPRFDPATGFGEVGLWVPLAPG